MARKRRKKQTLLRKLLLIILDIIDFISSAISGIFLYIGRFIVRYSKENLLLAIGFVFFIVSFIFIASNALFVQGTHKDDAEDAAPKRVISLYDNNDNESTSHISEYTERRAMRKQLHVERRIIKHYLHKLGRMHG